MDPLSRIFTNQPSALLNSHLQCSIRLSKPHDVVSVCDVVKVRADVTVQARRMRKSRSTYLVANDQDHQSSGTSMFFSPFRSHRALLLSTSGQMSHCLGGMPTALIEVFQRERLLKSPSLQGCDTDDDSLGMSRSKSSGTFNIGLATPHASILSLKRTSIMWLTFFRLPKACNADNASRTWFG